MAFEIAQLLASLQVPEQKSCVIATRQCVLAVGSAGDVHHDVGVARQVAQFFTTLSIVKAEAIVVLSFPRKHPLPIRAKGDSPDLGNLSGVTLEAKQLLACIHVEDPYLAIVAAE